MNSCPKCGCEIDDMSDCCLGCMASVQSCLSAIEGSFAGMTHSDLVMTCEMLTRGRAEWRKECEEAQSQAKELWRVLVMLKRGFDIHETNPRKLEIDSADWDEAVRRSNAVKPTNI